MIDVKIIKKPKNKATTPTVRTPGAAYGDKSVKEAVHASKADMAKMAEKASLAEQAEHAKKADEATRADEAEHAKKADEATTADEAYKAYKLLDDYPEFKGVTAKEYLQTQKIKSQNIQNSDTITTKNINVTGKATFFELEIQKAKAAGGMTIYSPGAFHIDEVVDTGNYYACYQRAEQDGVKLMQKCEVGDQLMCARFNVDGNGNKFYWMRVAYASPNIVQRVVDGKLVDYLEVDLDKSVKADNCQGVPEVGDALAVVGNRRKEERQSVIVISAYNSLDVNLHAPYIAQYEHVNDFNLESKKTTWLSKGGNNLTGTFTVVSGGKYMSLDDFVTKISQATFKVEAGKITARIDGVEKTLSDTTKKYSELQITLNSISSTVARKSDLEDVRTEIKQTANSISLKVENGARPNLLWGSDLNLDGVDTTSKEAIQRHLGVGIASAKIDSKEWFEYLKGGGVSGADAIKFKAMKGTAEFAGLYWEIMTGAARNLRLKPNTVYTLSAWIKTEFDKDAQGYGVFAFEAFKKETDNSIQRVGKLNFKAASSSFEPVGEWTRLSATFTTEELKYGSVAMWINGTKPATLYICRPKLEEGDTATPWCAYDGTVEALLASGLDIKNRKMIATTDNFMVQNNKGEWTFLLDENGHINAKLISAESITAQKIAQPFVEQKSFDLLMTSPSLSWYITKGDDINKGYVLASELNGAVLNIYNHTTETIKFYSTLAVGKTTYSNKTVNVLVKIEPGAMFRAFGVPIKGVEMITDNGTTTLVALVPLVPMELTSLEGDVRARYVGVVKGFLTIK
ncbi:hypothetical protein [Hallella bergensis]|uniref:hypothetical protein n=1 Tax=Hallella bergensis TaxID=242750 RepID=UPI003990BF33